MLKNYLIIALRNMLRNRTYSSINVIGLAIGLAFCILTFLFISHENSYDRFHENAAQVYRLYSSNESEDNPINIWTSHPLNRAYSIAQQFPQIKNITRINDGFKSMGINYVVRGNNKVFKEDLMFTDPSFFEIFDFPLEQGHIETALADLHSIIISENIAAKYFDNLDPIGKRMSIKFPFNNQFHDFTVSGVIKDIPFNSSIRLDILLSMEAFANNLAQLSGSRAHEIYIELQDEVNPTNVAQQITAFINQNENIAENTEIFNLQPLEDIHHNVEIGKLSIASVRNPVYAYIMAGIAIIVLISASINFVNLSIGYYATRTREVGLRRVTGAMRFQIVIQFFSESFIFCFIAFLFGIVISEMFLHSFNRLVESNISSLALLNRGAWLFYMLLFLSIGLLSGVYPSMILSKLKPVDAFSKSHSFKGSNRFSKALIVFQFTISLFLLSIFMIMTQQLNFIKKKDIGLKGEQVLVINAIDLDQSKASELLEKFRDTVIQNPHVLSISSSTRRILTDLSSPWMSTSWRDKSTMVYGDMVDEYYIQTLGLNVIEGRAFSEAFSTDAVSSVIVNETLVKEFGMEDPIGQQINVGGGSEKRTIIGIVQDYHFLPMHNQIMPAILVPGNQWLAQILVKIAPENIKTTISTLENEWQKLAPSIPFIYSFLDEDIARQYLLEERINKMIRYGSVLSFMIASLGIFGLVRLSCIKRTKEIGIRKVVGASVTQVVALISKEFLVLVLIANVIAWPIAWFAMHRWLENFAYRIDLGLGVFILAGLLALVIALVTVSWQTIRAATANPVEALRYE